MKFNAIAVSGIAVCALLAGVPALSHAQHLQEQQQPAAPQHHGEKRGRALAGLGTPSRAPPAAAAAGQAPLGSKQEPQQQGKQQQLQQADGAMLPAAAGSGEQPRQVGQAGV